MYVWSFSFLMNHKHFYVSFMFCIYVFSNFSIVDIDCWVSRILFKYDFMFNYYCLWGKFRFKNFSYGSLFLRKWWIS